MTGGALRRPWTLFALGVPIGFASSLAGIGGGLFAGSILHFLCGFELRRATGTALVLVWATTFAATVTESTQAASALDWSAIAALVPGVLVGAQLGFIASERLPDRALKAVFAVCLLYGSFRLIAGGGAPAGGALGLDEASGWQRAAIAFVVGVGGGLATPVLGVGGGMVMVPGLLFGVGLGFDAARASSLAAGCVSSTRSLVLKSRAGRVTWRFGLYLGAGALLGSAAGVTAIDGNPELVEVGRWILAGVLGFIGLRFLRELLRRTAQA